MEDMDIVPSTDGANVNAFRIWIGRIITINKSQRGRIGWNELDWPVFCPL
jgi:hypothetical protein